MASCQRLARNLKGVHVGVTQFQTAVAVEHFCPLRSPCLAPKRRQNHSRKGRSIGTSYSRSLSSSSITSSRLSLRDLPEKAVLRSGPLGRLAKVITPRESSVITTRVGSSYGGNHSLEWRQTPRNVLIVKKIHDTEATKALHRIIDHLNSAYPDVNIIVEASESEHLSGKGKGKEIFTADESEKDILASKVDLVVTLGGDGTILHVSSLFDKSAVPPVLSFSMGTLGFLLPYHIQSFERAFDDVVQSKASLLQRM